MGWAKIEHGQISKSSATFNYSCGGFQLPDGLDTGETIITYSSLSYSWVFTGGGTSSTDSGSITISSLPSGKEGSFTGTVSVSCIKTVTTIQYNEEGIPISTESESSTEDLGSASATISYWTKPQSFSFNVQSEGIVGLTLYASKVRDFGSHVGQYQRWYYQDGSYADKVYNVSSGDLITAALYNQIANDVGAATVTTNTIISAALWNTLANKVN